MGTKTSDGGRYPHLLSMHSLNMCRVFVFPKHNVSHTALSILNDRSHVLYLPTQKRFQSILDGRYDERQEGLWLDIISNPLQKKRVVRSWALRRVKQALAGALRTRGFDRSGKRLADPAATTLEGSELNSNPFRLTSENIPEALIGTVHVQVLEMSLEMNFIEVQRQAGLMVEEILEICGRGPRHRDYRRQLGTGLKPHGNINIEQSSWRGSEGFRRMI